MYNQLTKIEKLAEQSIIKCYGESEGKALWGGYVNARERAFKKVLPFIVREERELTDHGPEHILDVLNKAMALLGEQVCSGADSKTSLNANEMYFLMLAILLHDAGNIFGRKEHNSKLVEAYKYCRGEDSELAKECRLLYPIIKAHCGKSKSGSSDTIKDLPSNESFKQNFLDSRRVGAILRFADELAEGPQRTSSFISENFGYSNESKTYHDYASVTEIAISRPDERIVISYDIDVCFGGNKIDEARLRKLLELCEIRAVKLDLERKYATHYCSLLRPFKRTEISFHFNYSGDPIDLELDLITLTDLILPETQNAEKLSDRFTHISQDNVVDAINKAIKEVHNEKPI